MVAAKLGIIRQLQIYIDISWNSDKLTIVGKMKEHLCSLFSKKCSSSNDFDDFY